MIRLLDVTKRLGDRYVLDKLTLHVEKGETFVIIGGSGTGKSVTLKHCVGLMKPDAGRIVVDGEDITDFRPRDLLRIRRKFGYVFQSAALIAWMTVAENVALPLREHTTLAEKEIETIVSQKLAMVEMEGTQNRFPAELSGGMRRRVGLARALVLDPSIVLYDEPDSGLDPIITARIADLIRATQKKLAVTSIVVTHKMKTAFHVADRIGMLFRGRLIWTGSAEEIQKTDHPVVRAFVDGRYVPEATSE